jgi:hypothetical protein
MEYQHWTIKKAMACIVANELYLPAIQRKFVWEASQIERLFDSIMRDYPIGTFLFWMVEEAKKNEYSFYKFIRDFHARDNWKNELAANPHLPDKLVGVLDGQQRLNSMYVALQGSYAYKRPRVWANNPNAFPERKFFLNVFKRETEDDEQDYIYEFRFKTVEEAEKITPGECWCQVKDLLGCSNITEVITYWTNLEKRILKEVEVTDEIKKYAQNTLGMLWQRLTMDEIINYYPVKNQDLDEILDIFVRVNSAGTSLSKTDLLFSTIVAQWEDGREIIEEFLEKLNKKGNRFAFSTDFIMRACLVLAGCPIQLRVASFKAENVNLIVKDWNLITEAIGSAVDLLVEWGFQGETLPSANAVIPIAYAIKRGCDLKASKTDLRLLFIKSLLTGVYGSSSDQVLASIRKTIEEMVDAGGPFDLTAFEKKARLQGGKSIAINEETLDDLLLTTKGARSFALLSMLTPHLRFNQVQFHQDHIHPHAGFNDAALRKLNLTDIQILDWQAKRDALPNLHLLEGKENISKQATPFAEWLNKEHPKTTDAETYILSHHIPNISLELKDFAEFFEKRKILLKNKLAEMLNVSLK